MAEQKLTLVRGLPGSGKSTYAKAMAETEGGVVIEADMYMVDAEGKYKYDRTKLQMCHEMCLRKTEIELLKGKSVFVANTFTRRWEMQPYKDVAHRLGISVHVHVCNGKWKNKHHVPEETIDIMNKRWEDDEG